MMGRLLLMMMKRLGLGVLLKSALWSIFLAIPLSLTGISRSALRVKPCKLAHYISDQL